MSYRLIVGTDSMARSEKTTFVTAILIHRVGHGGRYFYRKLIDRPMKNLHQRILREASLSLEVANEVVSALQSDDAETDVEIHVDVGTNGETRKFIKEVVGMIVGSGYAAVTKPESVGASYVADRHSR